MDAVHRLSSTCVDPFKPHPPPTITTTALENLHNGIYMYIKTFGFIAWPSASTHMFCKYNECSHFFGKLKDEATVFPKSFNRSLITRVKEQRLTAVKLLCKQEKQECIQ